jgi:hypothetical protein
MTISIQGNRTVLPLTNIKTITLAPPTGVSQEGDAMICKINSVTDMSDGGIARKTTKADVYLGVAVIQSNNSTMTEVLSGLGGDILRYIGPTNNWKGTYKFDDILQDYLTDRGIKGTVADFKSKNMIVKTVKLFGDRKGPTLEKMGNDGQKMITIPHEFDFAVSSRRPGYLAYFSLSYYEVNDGTRGYEDSTTPVKNDVVFNNGVLSSSTYFYLLPNGKYWSGPVAKEGAVYITADGKKTKLKLRRTSNVKIQDFRNRDVIADVPVMDDFLNEKETVINIDDGTSPKIRDLDPSKTMDHPYVSEALISSDATKKAKFMFMINFEDLIFNNSIYGHLWKTPYSDIRQDILKRSRIKSLKIFRHKVKQTIGSNSVGTSQRYIPEKDDVPALIAVTGQAASNPHISATDSIQEESDVLIPLDRESNIRSFNVSDNSLPTSARSQYRYHVEIEAYDGSKDFLRDKITKLESFSRTLKNYLTEILSSTTTTDLRVSDPSVAPTLRRPEGYDPRYNMLTPDFASKMKSKYWESILSGKEEILEVIEIFSGPGVSIEAINNFAVLALNPDSANPDNISSFSDLLEGIISKMNLSVGQAGGVSSNQNSESVYGTSASKNIISVVKYFGDIFDLTDHEDGGYDYLSSDANGLADRSTRGLSVISGASFRNRIQQEVLKYYTDSNPSIRINGRTFSYKENYMSYLSPSQVVVGSPGVAGNIVNILRSQSEDMLKIVESKFLANRASRDATGFAVPENGRFANLIDNSLADNPTFSANYLQSFLAQDFSLTSACEEQRSKDKDHQPQIPVAEDDQDDEIDSKATNPLGSLSAAALAPAALYDSLIRAELVSSPKSNKSNSSAARKNSIGRLRNQQISDLPNQIKAFLLTDSAKESGTAKLKNSSRVNMVQDGRYSSTATFNYRLLARIEYLEGFSQSSDGVNLLSSPKWKRLTEADYGGFVGKAIVCRIVKYDNQLLNDWGLSRPESLNMRIYNEYFLLTPDTITGAPEIVVPRGGTRNLKSPNTRTRGSRFTDSSEFGSTRFPAPIVRPPKQKVIKHTAKLMELSKDIRFDSNTNVPTVQFATPTAQFSSKDEVVLGYETLLKAITEDAKISVVDEMKIKALDDYGQYLPNDSLELVAEIKQETTKTTKDVSKKRVDVRNLSISKLPGRK